MCFIPVSCLKAIVFIGSICSIVISIGLLALTIYVQVEKKQVISSASQSAVSASLIALYISSIVFLLLGVAGLAGSLKSSKNKQNKGTCLLALFSIGIFVFFIFFLAATIFFFVGPETIFGNNCTSGSKIDLINSLYNTSQQAYSIFCSPGCRCNVTNPSELYDQLTNAGYSLDGNATKFSDCPIKNSSSQTIDVLAVLENILQCGGWCNRGDSQSDLSPYYFYRFRNINDCTTADCYKNLPGCHDAFETFMTGSGRLMGFGCLIAVLVCFINIVAVCCICFHPSRTNKSSNFYSRMIEMD